MTEDHYMSNTPNAQENPVAAFGTWVASRFDEIATDAREAGATDQEAADACVEWFRQATEHFTGKAISA